MQQTDGTSWAGSDDCEPEEEELDDEVDDPRDLRDMRDLRDPDDDGPPPESDEDTEEASESEIGRHDEPIEMREQIYQDKLANLKMQLQQLREHTHPEYLRRVRKLEQQYAERRRLNTVQREYALDCIDNDYTSEKKAAAKEFEEKKIELKENLIADFEDKRKHIENERYSMELNGDSMEAKPAMTRKLRRRPNEPAPIPDKRRKPLTTTLIFTLDDREIASDLRQISRARPPTVNQSRKQYGPLSPVSNIVESPNVNSENRAPSPISEVRVEDGKLLFERRWYHRGQSIFVESQDYARYPAHITGITSDCIWVKKATSDGNKLRIYTNMLARGKITIKRRAP